MEVYRFNVYLLTHGSSIAQDISDTTKRDTASLSIVWCRSVLLTFRVCTPDQLAISLEEVRLEVVDAQLPLGAIVQAVRYAALVQEGTQQTLDGGASRLVHVRENPAGVTGKVCKISSGGAGISGRHPILVGAARQTRDKRKADGDCSPEPAAY